MNELRIFESADFGVIRTLGTSEEPLFNANDVCTALGYGNPRKAVADHVDAEDVTKRYTLTGRGKQEMTYVYESGLYSLIFGSTKPEAKAFKKWVTSEVLPSIRKTGEYKTPSKKMASINQVRSAYEAIKLKKEIMGLNDSSVALLINKTDELLGIEGQRLDYTPSHGVLKPISVLLKEHNVPMSAVAFNRTLEQKGFLARISRKSSKGEKHFYSITEKGREFGENQVCPQNPRETQPMWYADRFDDLLK